MLRFCHAIGKDHRGAGGGRGALMPPIEPLPRMEPVDELGAFVPGPLCWRAATGRGALDGWHFAVKDLIDVAGYRTGGGHPDWLRDQPVAADSAPVVRMLLAAGATLAGKTITDELAFSLEGRNVHYGMPINPACPDRIPGGSSSGSAVAVAGGLVDFALGTDTGGSVRVPASFVGVCGFRPTHGTVSLDGVIPFAPSYDTVAWFARDAGLLAQVGAVLLPRRRTLPITRLWLVSDAFALADTGVERRLRKAVADWPLAGEKMLFEGRAAAWLECYRVLQGREIWQNLGPWIGRAKPQFGADIAARFADAATISADQAEGHRAARAAFAARLGALVPVDTALVIPTAPCPALRRDADAATIAAFYRRALTLGSIAGHCGAPQVSLPAVGDEGCPIGVSLVAARGCDLALLDLAQQLHVSRTLRQGEV
jgi:amidase